MGKWGKDKPGSSIPTLDLHGFKVDDVFDAVEKFIRREEGKGTQKVRIMPGKGTGKVKEQMLAYLRQANYPAKPEPLANGGVNDGSYLVFLD